MIAVGVASPSAHGQAITSTATALSAPPVAAAQAPTQQGDGGISSTTGTKTALTWSTRRWIGLAACACSTMRMMRQSGFGADCGGGHQQQTCAVDGAGGHPVAAVFLPAGSPVVK